MAKPGELKQQCYLIDAKDKILGKVATKAAMILRGKHKPTYTPHVDTGDMVVVINADKVRLSGKKASQKSYQRYSGYPSGQKVVPFEIMLAKKPFKVIELAVAGMIPSGPMGTRARSHLKVYAGDKHPHQAQQPIAIEI